MHTHAFTHTHTHVQALRVGVDLENKGVLDRYNIEVLGTSVESIEATEDRDAFTSRMHKINEVFL
jgi:carbamoylphosphate synthase large subunit